MIQRIEPAEIPLKLSSSFIFLSSTLKKEKRKKFMVKKSFPYFFNNGDFINR